eukprot:14139792-Alexandrium_andersonii.AAC.1
MPAAQVLRVRVRCSGWSSDHFAVVAFKSKVPLPRTPGLSRFCWPRNALVQTWNAHGLRCWHGQSS